MSPGGEGERPAGAADVYARPPLSRWKGIPVFSAVDSYTENYERIAEDHTEHFDAHGSNPFIVEDIWRRSEDSTLELVRRFSRPGDRVLDVGVGTGRLMAQLPALERYGMDIAMAYLERARGEGIEVCYSLAEDMPYRPESFDLVVCTDVLEHVLDLNLVCRRILSAVARGGFLIVRVPYREELASYTDPRFPYRFCHLRNFDEHSLKLLFEKVFDCRVVATTLAAHDFRGRVRLRVPERAAAVVTRALAGARRLAVRARLAPLRWLVDRVYRPLAINVVVEKTAPAPAAGEGVPETGAAS